MEKHETAACCPSSRVKIINRSEHLPDHTVRMPLSRSEFWLGIFTQINRGSRKSPPAGAHSNASAAPVHETRARNCSLCWDRNDRTTAKLLYPAHSTEEDITNQRSCTPPPGTCSSFVALQEARHEAPGDRSMLIKTFVGNGPKKQKNQKRTEQTCDGQPGITM